MNNRAKNGFAASVCVYFTVLFGLWTIFCNVTVAVGGTFHELKTSLIFLIPIAIGIISYCRKNDQALMINHDVDLYPDYHFGWKPAIGICCVGLLLTFAGSYLLFWFVATTSLFIAYICCLRAPQLSIDRPIPSKIDIYVITSAVAIAALVTIFANRPDADDSLYLNMAVSVIDHPDTPLFSKDTLHNIHGAFVLPIYRVHALEVLYGFIADLMSQEPLVIAHLWLPPIFSALSVFAIALVMQIILKTDWAWATLAAVVIFVITREVHHAYGNFAYVRIFQGKAILVAVMVPLIINYAMEFSSRATLRSWILLALAQAAAVGMTSNAIHVAPIAAGLVLTGCCRLDRHAIMRFGVGLLASIYPICVGIYVKYQLAAQQLNLEHHEGYVPIAETIDGFFGHGPTRYILLGALIGSWMVINNKATRLLLIAIALCFLALFLNPFSDHLVAFNITGPSMLWRLLWAVPIPIMAALLLSCFSRIFHRVEVLRLCFFAFCLIVAFVALPVTVSPGRLRVPEPAFATAKLLGLLANKGEYVLASDDISAWITTYRQHPFPVISRQLYVNGLVTVFSKHVDVSALEKRSSVFRYISGNKRSTQSSKNLEKIIEQLKIKAIALNSANPWCGEILGILKKHDFAVLNFHHYAIAYRNTEWPAGIAKNIFKCRNIS